MSREELVEQVIDARGLRAVCIYGGVIFKQAPNRGDVGRRVLVLTFIFFVELVIRRSSEDINCNQGLYVDDQSIFFVFFFIRDSLIEERFFIQ